MNVFLCVVLCVVPKCSVSQRKEVLALQSDYRGIELQRLQSLGGSKQTNVQDLEENIENMSF
ncbi:hypothetical protein ACJW31_07G002200 [Castanea mollissima]